jgi:enamine deaminase RidA (YjgF/YER057c/UK114 family)
MGPKPRGDYSMISVTQPGDRLAFLAGQTGRLPDGTISPDSRQQVVDAFDNVETLLRSVDSGPSSIVHLRTFLVGRAVLGAFTDARAAVYGRWFGDLRPPSNTLLIVNGLADPEAIVEIEAVAATDDADRSTPFDRPSHGK